MFRIKEEHRSKFNPYFSTAIGGVPVKVTIGELEKEPMKYINTPLAEFYEKSEELKERLSKSKKKNARKLNMSKGQIGFCFAEGFVNDRVKAVNKYLDLSGKKRSRLKAKADQEAKAKADQEAKAKADQEAKAKADQEAKAKADQEAKAKKEAQKKSKSDQAAAKAAAEAAAKK